MRSSALPPTQMERSGAQPESRAPAARIVGRYALHGEIAAGGMATVHIGRLLGPVGFSRTVAIKRLHAQYAKDPEFVSMFVDEARLAARIRHPNVVSTLDVVAVDDELFLVMDYIQGESLARVWGTFARRGERLPPKITAAILVGALNGLHAAHEARDEHGVPLAVVHRDVSPQNILVGIDGIPRVLDFGVAKAAGRTHTTRDGQIKGKLAYMAPEQFRNEPVTRAVDVHAAAIVLWEALTGKRLIVGDSDAAIVERVLYGTFPPPSELVPELPKEIDAIVARGLARSPAERYPTAREMADALERCLGVASMNEIADWVVGAAGSTLDKRARMVAAIERSTDRSGAMPAQLPVGLSAVELPPVDEPTQAATALTTATVVERKTGPESVTGELARSARGRRRLLAFGGVLLLGGGLVAFALTRAPTPRAPSTDAAPSAVAAPLAARSVAPEPTSVSSAPGAPGAMTSSVAAGASTSGSSGSSAQAPRPVARPPKKGPAPPPKGAPPTGKAKSVLPTGLPEDRN